MLGPSVSPPGWMLTMCTFPPLTAELFGQKYLGANYGFIAIGFSIGAIVSSQIGGHFKNLAAHDISLMFPAFVITSGCALGGIGMVLAMKRIIKRQNARAATETS